MMALAPAQCTPLVGGAWLAALVRLPGMSTVMILAVAMLLQRKKDLDRAFTQLQQNAVALENPPLLIVSDMTCSRIQTNWIN